MTKPKQIAGSLKNILDNKILKTILDKSSKIGDVSSQILNYWSFDVEDKIQNFSIEETDKDEIQLIEKRIDLATFLVTLKSKNSVIVIPEYLRRRPKSIKNNEVVIDQKNRTGEIINVTSNKKTFGFGIRIKDRNVLNLSNKDQLGYRTFLITDFDGVLYEGWDTLNFDEHDIMNKWISDLNITNKNKFKISFTHFINPEKWICLYGKKYFLLKCLVNRLEDQTKYMNYLIKDMLKKGFRYCSSKKGAKEKYEFEKSVKEKGVSEKIWTFQVKVDSPLENKYPSITYSNKVLTAMSNKYRELKRDLNYARFISRCIELAFALKHPYDEEGNIENFHYPYWIKDAEWTKQKMKRTSWYRLKYVQKEVGQLSYGLRVRWIKRSEKVNRKK